MPVFRSIRRPRLGCRRATVKVFVVTGPLVYPLVKHSRAVNLDPDAVVGRGFDLVCVRAARLSVPVQRARKWSGFDGRGRRTVVPAEVDAGVLARERVGCGREGGWEPAVGTFRYSTIQPPAGAPMVVDGAAMSSETNWPMCVQPLKEACFYAG